jgi:hypothetical protein
MMTTSQASEVGDTKVAFRGRADTFSRQRRAGDRTYRGQVLTTRVGMQIPADLAFEDWERAGRQLAGIVDSSAWWLGDWLVYGKEHYADRYQLGIRTAGLQYQTLRNYAWVARRFELNRRRPALTFQHHAEVASLPIPEQEFWLDRAERVKWSTKQLRTAIRGSREDEAPASRQGQVTRRLAVPGNRFDSWNKAAEQVGIDFEQWVLATLDTAAERVLGEDGEAAGTGFTMSTLRTDR